MEAHGCHVPRQYFQCLPCSSSTPDPSENSAAGAYFDSQQGIVICENKVDKGYIKNSLNHELIHAFDFCRAHVSSGNCLHVACTEIRAANLSGDCKFSREWFVRGELGLLNKQHQRCVRRRAQLSLELHPQCKSPEASQTAIDKAWQSCFYDLAPFDSIP